VQRSWRSACLSWGREIDHEIGLLIRSADQRRSPKSAIPLPSFLHGFSTGFRIPMPLLAVLWGERRAMELSR
jgi:hypothetical protein